jgi:hypothetical protein
MENLSRSARTIYLKLCYAGLAEDMSQRIMYSLLPHVADSAQVSLTQGTVDVKALRHAIAGRKDIINYGTKTILDEIEHYGTTLGNSDGDNLTQTLPHSEMLSFINSGDMETALDVAIDAFADTKAWASRFGGRAWEMIAKTVRQIVRLDKGLDAIRHAEPSPENAPRELQIMRDLIVQMNIFDGLAHNTDSIITKMVDVETAVKNPMLQDKELRKKNKANHKRLQKIMDAKELENPNEVFKQIQDTLTDSGDINKFKEWVGKMRQKKEYHQRDPSTAPKLFMIRNRKSIIPVRSQVNEFRDFISASITELEHNWNEYKFLELCGKVDWAFGEIEIATAELANNKETFLDEYPEFEEARPAINAMSDKLTSPANKIVNSLAHLVRGLQNLMTPIPEEKKLPLLARCKQALAVLNRYSFFLDTI